MLKDVSLEPAPGGVVAVIGRRLGGKSTLLQIVAGIQAPDVGTVTLAGRPVRVPGRRSVRKWWAARRAGSSDPVLEQGMVLVTRDGPHQDLEVCKYVGGPLAVRRRRGHGTVVEAVVVEPSANRNRPEKRKPELGHLLGSKIPRGLYARVLPRTCS